MQDAAIVCREHIIYNKEDNIQDALHAYRIKRCKCIQHSTQGRGLVLCLFASGEGSYLFAANWAPFARLSHTVGLNPPMATEATPDVFCGQVGVRNKRQ